MKKVALLSVLCILSCSGCITYPTSTAVSDPELIFFEPPSREIPGAPPEPDLGFKLDREAKAKAEAAERAAAEQSLLELKARMLSKSAELPKSASPGAFPELELSSLPYLPLGAPGSAARAPASAPAPSVPVAPTAHSAPTNKPTLIRLFFATSRTLAEPSLSRPKKHPRYFGNGWDPGPLTYGVCNVSMPTDKDLPPGEIEGSTWMWIFDLADNRRQDVWMHRPTHFAGSNEFFRALAVDIPRRAHRSVLVGVHGFNNTFEFAGRRLAKMVHDMNYHGTPVLYSWAAGETVRAYGHDEEQIGQPHEIEQFVAFLEMVVDCARDAGAMQVHLVAHSMGNRLIQHAAVQLAKKLPPGRRFLDAVVLAAPDIPQKGFVETIWPSLQRLTQRCALYVSAYDRALFGSAKIHDSGPRLGQAGGSPLVAKGLETIDASKADDTFLHHDYHLRLAGICDLTAFLVRRWEPALRVANGFLRFPSQPLSAGWFELVAGEGDACEW